MKEHAGRWLTVLFALALTGYTAYVLLDTFVIARVYERISAPEEPVIEAIRETGVTMTRLRAYDSDVYVAEVRLSEPGQLKTALAKNTYGRNVTGYPSDIAQDCGALLAVNGDYYGSRNSGYVIRNGVLYRSRSAGASQEDLAIMADGSFFLFREGEMSAEKVLSLGAQQVFSFGPGLVSGGEIVVDKNSEVGKSMASNPRTALGMIEPLHYLFVVSDGRTASSSGLSLYELAEVLRSLGAKEAYNLDGGGSSAMVYQGEVINVPTTNGRRVSERAVSDIVYIAQ